MNNQARAAGRRLLPVYEELDAGVQEGMREASITPSCRRGCNHCCYNLAAVSILEAIPIAEYLLTSDVWKPRLKEIRTELALQAAIIDELGGVGSLAAITWLDRKIPCVFLKKNGECGVYKIRPAVCRTYFVVSPPEDCSSDKNGNQVGVVNVQQAMMSFWSQTLTREMGAVPPAMDSLQHSVIYALELLERGKEGFHEWMKQNNIQLEILHSIGALSSSL